MSDPTPAPTAAALLETLAAAAHEGWMDGKRAAGVISRLAEWGEEFMVPYTDLSERAKDIDRAAVRSVLTAIEQAGFTVVTAGAVAEHFAARQAEEVKSAVAEGEVRRLRARLDAAEAERDAFVRRVEGGWSWVQLAQEWDDPVGWRWHHDGDYEPMTEAEIALLTEGDTDGP